MTDVRLHRDQVRHAHHSGEVAHGPRRRGMLVFPIDRARELDLSASDVQAKIEAALKWSAEVGARRINVSATDGKVVLSGNVHSWFERNEARRAAWSAPGVKDVELAAEH